MKTYTIAFLVLGACGGSAAQPPPVDPPPAACAARDVAFVKAATLAVLGRRPLGRDEVRAAAAFADQPAELIHGLSKHPAYVEHWTEVVMDHLRVQRSDLQTMLTCYGASERALDDGALARHVRDHGPQDGGDGLGTFTARDLLRSSIQLDDLSPALRGHLFAMMRVAIRTCNQADYGVAELTRRRDFGDWFSTAYLNRDTGCLGCHNSETSVTYSEDPS